MANINVKNGEVFAPPQVPVGADFDVQFRLNNRESIALGGATCKGADLNEPGPTPGGHLTTPKVRVSANGNVVKETANYQSVTPESASRPNNQVCCVVDGALRPDPIVTFTINPQTKGTYAITAISDPPNSPTNTATINVDAVPPDQFSGPTDGDVSFRNPINKDGPSVPGTGFGGPALQFAKDNPLLAGVGGIAAIVAIREGTDSLLGN